MNNKKILIIDDQKDITFILSTLLKFHKLDVVAINDPANALSTIESNDFKLVILDYMMPGKTGIEIAHELRNNPKYQKLKLLLYTVKNLSSDELEILKDLNVIYLRKPMPPNDLVKKITEIIWNNQ